MRLRNIALATLGLAGSILLQAQPPGPRHAPDVSALKAYLNLTDAQVTSLGDITKAQRDATRTVADELRAKHQAMNTAMRSGSTDSATLNSAAQAIQAGEQRMQSIRQQYQAQAVAVLTPDQQAKLKTLSDAAALAPNIHEAAMLGLINPPAGGPRGGGGPGDMMMRRGPGPGGPGGHPPPPQD